MFRKSIIIKGLILLLMVGVLVFISFAAWQKVWKGKKEEQKIEVENEAAKIEEVKKKEIEIQTAREELTYWEKHPWELIFWINAEDPLLEELKIELELTDEQLQKFKEALDYERRRDIIARSLDYREKDLIYLDEKEKEIEKSDIPEEEKEEWKRWIKEQRKKDEEDIKKFNEEYNKLPELTAESIKKIFKRRQYEEFKEWVEIQKRLYEMAIHSAYYGPVPKENRDKFVFEREQKKFNELWQKHKEEIYMIVAKGTKAYSLELRKALELDDNQYKEILKMMEDKKWQILGLRKDLTFIKEWRNAEKNQEILNKIRQKKEDMESLIRKTLTSPQKIKYQQIKEKQ
jgi:hypothetical protein